MVREYFLFLDESGDFDADLNSASKNECLVGGFYVSADKLLKEYEIDNKLIDAWVSIFPEQKGKPRNEILNASHHATELDQERKAKAVAGILQALSSVGEFVVFENYHKSKVVNSTITYANILAEGVIQLLTRLALEDIKNPVKLNIVAGGRRDMTVLEKEYIDGAVISSRFDERLKLSEIKSQSLSSLGAKYSLEIGNDKRNSYLILCDYICFFYFTRNYSRYDAVLPGDKRCIREVLLKLYKQENILSLRGNSEDERLLYGITNEAYGNLLFDAATGVFESKVNIEKIIRAFCLLQEETRRVHLSILSNRIYEVIGNKRNIELGEIILNFADNLNNEMQKKEISDSRFELEIILYRLTLAAHKGKNSEMEGLFNEGAKLIPKLIQYTENYNLIFMFINRYAVFLIDEFEIEKAYNLLEKTINQFEAFEFVGEGLIEILSPISVNIEKNGNLLSEQKGKLYGTQTQAGTYLVKKGLKKYEDIVAINENAVSNFEIEKDIFRQYQYRAELEGVQGNFEKSYEYLIKSLGISKIQMLKIDDNVLFSLYHISKVFNYFAGTGRKELDDMKKVLRDNESKYIENTTYPSFVINGNIAEAYTKMGENKNRIKKFFLMSQQEGEEDTPIIRMLKLMFLCSYVSYLKEVGDDYQAEEKRVIERSEQMIFEDIPQRMRQMLNELLHSSDENKFKDFASKRQY